jgi:hypothetical protein
LLQPFTGTEKFENETAADFAGRGSLKHDSLCSDLLGSGARQSDSCTLVRAPSFTDKVPGPRARRLIRPWSPTYSRLHADLATTLPRKPITAQNMDEAKAAAYANDPQTELVILGLSENAAVTTCGWARHFFDRDGSNGF